MFPASAVPGVYRCPGESHDISRPVHLARLAAAYAKCRNCAHRHESPRVERLAGGESTLAELPQRQKLFTPSGVRGVHLNELSRQSAAEIAGAFASCLWDDAPAEEHLSDARPPGNTGSDEPPPIPPYSSPPIGGPDPDTASEIESSLARLAISETEGMTILPAGRGGPLVILGHDERPSSPDIVTGAGQALRRMGCQVIDIGLATRPCFWFSVAHLGAVGGVHVTGSGCDPAWTGLDFVRAGIKPCLAGGDLDRIEQRYARGYRRPTRHPGSQCLFQASVPYESNLWKHFHGLRPFQIALACPSRVLRELFARMFSRTACRLIPVETPSRRRDCHDPLDPDIQRTSRTVRDSRAHLGLLLDDDAQRVVLFDELGRLVAGHQVERLLTGGGGLPNLRIVDRVDEAAGHFWFRDAYDTCDAVLTVVHILQALSQQDTPASLLLR